MPAEMEPDVAGGTEVGSSRWCTRPGVDAAATAMSASRIANPAGAVCDRLGSWGGMTAIMATAATASQSPSTHRTGNPRSASATPHRWRRDMTHAGEKGHMADDTNRPTLFERIRGLPVVGQALDWGLGPSAVS